MKLASLLWLPERATPRPAPPREPAPLGDADVTAQLPALAGLSTFEPC
jgi:hypothetical protein